MNITAFGILALRAAGQGDVGKSADWLRDAQNSNGGWGFAPGRGSEADSTGAALQALGGGRWQLVRAFATEPATSLRPRRATAAGRSRAASSNSQSTAWAVQGLVAAGGSGSAISKGVSYLAKRQAGDGHYAYSSCVRPDARSGSRRRR